MWTLLKNEVNFIDMAISNKTIVLKEKETSPMCLSLFHGVWHQVERAETLPLHLPKAVIGSDTTETPVFQLWW